MRSPIGASHEHARDADGAAVLDSRLAGPPSRSVEWTRLDQYELMSPLAKSESFRRMSGCPRTGFVPLALRCRALTRISGLSHCAVLARLSRFKGAFSIDIAANFSAHSALACDGGRHIAGPTNSSSPPLSRA